MKPIKLKCDNPDCDVTFSTTNSKKRFCSISCKNHTAYLFMQDVYRWEQKLLKDRIKIIRILEDYYARGILYLNDADYKKMGLNLRAVYIPYKDEKGRSVFRFGNIGIVVISKEEDELIRIPINHI